MHKRRADIAAQLRASLLLRWTLANALGWMAGALLATLSLKINLGFFSLFLAGAFAGALIGAAQWGFLRLWNHAFQPGWDWIAYSAAGGVIAVIPAFFAGFLLLISSHLGFAAVAGIFALSIAMLQCRLLQPHVQNSYWWPLGGLVGGVFGGGLWFIALVPLVLSLGPFVYGLATGLALRVIFNER